MSVINEVFEELEKAKRWMTTTELTEKLNRKRSSVGRALRRLYARDSVSKDLLPDARNLRQWATKVNGADANFPAAPAGANKPTKKKKGKVPKLRVIASNPPLNATSQGDLDMQMKEAVETVLKEWVAAERKFSAHEVTIEIRNRVNAGTVTIDPDLAGTTTAPTGKVTNIKHDLVRPHVHTYMDSERKYDQNMNPGGFFEYVPVKQADPDPNAGTPPAPTTSGSTYDGSSTL